MRRLKIGDDMLSRFHLISERHGHTDRRTDRFAVSISRVSMLTRIENWWMYVKAIASQTWDIFL